MKHVLLAAALISGPSFATTATITPFGTSENGDKVDQITLTNDTGMKVRLSTRGGTILEIQAPDRRGRFTNVVLTRPDFASWDRGGSFNALIGPFANRIAGAGFTLDGQFYPLPANPKTKVAIHGGPKGLDSQLWAPETTTDKTSASAILRHTSPDGYNGYPGELKVTVTYTLTNTNVLRLDYAAETTKPTIINLTNHAYFTLGGHENGPIYNQTLQVFAQSYTPTDDTQIPTGEIAPVADTPFDLQKPTKLLQTLYSTHPQILLARGLDHNFVLTGGVTPTPRRAARVVDPASGRQLEVRTTEPGVQIYAGNSLNGSMLADNNRSLRQADGIALETQHYPDSPNQPAFPTTTLRPGKPFHSITEFAFSTDKTPFK